MPAGSPVPALAGRRLSALPWCDALLGKALGRQVPFIRSAVEPWRPRLLFLGGSGALGEAVGWSTRRGECLPLSDLDLGVVTERTVPEQARRELRASLRREESPITLGFYERERMDCQAPTPGLVDLTRRGIVLWGEEGLLGRFHAPEPGRIPAWEAFRLVGNRALELLAAGISPSDRDPRAWYALGKAITGLWTSWLILVGAYRIGRAERAALLDSGVAQGAPPAVVHAARLWSAFAASPCAAHLPARDRSLPAFREALKAWLEAVPGSLRDPGEPPESPLLSEPCAVRLRIHLWRRFWRVCTDRGGLRLRLVRRWLASGMRGTPEGRRMAAAVLYWRMMPERPEPVWGDWGAEAREPISMEEWRAGTARFLGATVAPGKGSREALRRLLAAFDPS